jgi:hypothetical protein
METLSECLLIGIITAILYHYTIRLIKKNNKKINKFNIVMSFIFGFILHYFIKVYRLNDLYCKKVCYNDECFMICPI